MIYLKFIPVILYYVEGQAFVPPLDGSQYSYIDVQNSLNDKGTSNTPKL